MGKRFKIINQDAVAKALEDVRCGRARFGEISGQAFEIQAEEIQPPEGFTFPEKYPNCCEFHQHLYESSQTWFQEFPTCCKYHNKLLAADWFDKTHYQYVERKVVDQISYTEHIIYQKLDNPDWYEDITDYFDYNYSSFGDLPSGFGNAPGLEHYLSNLKHVLKISTNKKLTAAPEKREKLLQFVLKYYQVPGKSKVDFNQLDNIYRNWLRIFPFQISYFRELKSYFEKQFPIFKGQIKTNRYSKIAKVKVKTQSELIEWLHSTTKTLLDSVKSTELVKAKLIPDSKQHAVELISEKHRMAQDALVMDFQKGELKYVKVLQKWMTNEKNYFKELNPFLEAEANNTPKVQYPPVNEDVFEDFICDLYNALHPQSHYERFGKRGDNQKGIDILSVVRKEAIQCKQKDVSRKESTIKSELRAEFKADIVKAISLEVEIDLLIFVSTYKNNAGLEEHLQGLKKKLKPKFDVMYVGWNSLSGHLHQFKPLIKKYVK